MQPYFTVQIYQILSNNNESIKEWERIEHHMKTEIFSTNVK